MKKASSAVLKRPPKVSRSNFDYCAAAPSTLTQVRHHHDQVAAKDGVGEYENDTMTRAYQTPSQTVKPVCNRVL